MEIEQTQDAQTIPSEPINTTAKEHEEELRQAMERSKKFFGFNVMSFIDDFIDIVQEYLSDGLDELQNALEEAHPEKEEEINRGIEKLQHELGKAFDLKFDIFEAVINKQIANIPKDLELYQVFFLFFHLFNSIPFNNSLYYTIFEYISSFIIFSFEKNSSLFFHYTHFFFTSCSSLSLLSLLLSSSSSSTSSSSLPLLSPLLHIPPSSLLLSSFPLFFLPPLPLFLFLFLFLFLPPLLWSYHPLLSSLSLLFLTFPPPSLSLSSVTIILSPRASLPPPSPPTCPPPPPRRWRTPHWSTHVLNSTGWGG